MGELVQWSDILAVLYILGHSLTLSTEHQQLRSYIRATDSCPGETRGGLAEFDRAFLDIMAVREMKALNFDFKNLGCVCLAGG